MEDLQRKKLFIYGAVAILVFGGVGFVIYQLFVPGAKRTTERQAVTGRLPTVPGTKEFPAASPTDRFASTKAGEEISITPEQRLYRVTDFPVVSPTISKDEKKILFYKKYGGDLMSADLTGQNQEKVSNLTILGMVEAIWSPQKDRAAVFYLDIDQETLNGFLHIGTGTISVLPLNVRAFSWSPDGKFFAYLLPERERSALVTANSSGRNQRTELHSSIADAFISWVAENLISFHTAPSGFSEGYLFLWNRQTGSFNKIAGPLFGLMPLWSPDGSRVLISSTDRRGSNLKLTILNSAGEGLFEATVQTLPEKCVWGSLKEIYCAVPRILPESTVWPDDYLRGEINTSDRLVILDLERQTVNEIFNEGSFDMINLALTNAKDWLIWTDRKDGSLWSLKLK